MIPLRIQVATAVAERLIERLSPYCDRVQLAGSCRRRDKDFVKDIELVAIPKWEAGGMKATAKLSERLREYKNWHRDGTLKPHHLIYVADDAEALEEALAAAIKRAEEAEGQLSNMAATLLHIQQAAHDAIRANTTSEGGPQ